LALRLTVDTQTGRRPDDNPRWKCCPGNQGIPWVHQVEIDAGVSADEAWNTASTAANGAGVTDDDDANDDASLGLFSL